VRCGHQRKRGKTVSFEEEEEGEEEEGEEEEE